MWFSPRPSECGAAKSGAGSIIVLHDVYQGCCNVCGYLVYLFTVCSCGMTLSFCDNAKSETNRIINTVIKKILIIIYYIIIFLALLAIN